MLEDIVLIVLLIFYVHLYMKVSKLEIERKIDRRFLLDVANVTSVMGDEVVRLQVKSKEILGDSKL